MEREQILFDKIKEKIKENVTEVNTDIQAQVDKLNEKLEATKWYPQGDTSFISKVAAEAAKMQFKSGSETKELTLKTDPIDMGITTSTGAGVVEPDREPGIHSAPKRKPALLNVIGVGTTDSNSISWVEKTTETGTPVFRSEFESFPKRSWKTELKTTLVKKIAVMSEYSKEILEDVDGFQAELRQDLVQAIQLQLDENILRGDGGGADDADLQGILEVAESWDNDGVEIADANLYDVIAVANLQIEKEHHNANVVVTNPKTALKMKATKKDGKYVLPPFAGTNGQVIDGLRVVTNTLFNDGEMLIMDGSRAKFIFKRNWTLEISDSHDDNFEKDVIAVRLSGRGALRIKNCDHKAFVYVADADTAIATLLPTS